MKHTRIFKLNQTEGIQVVGFGSEAQELAICCNPCSQRYAEVIWVLLVATSRPAHGSSARCYVNAEKKDMFRELSRAALLAVRSQLLHAI